MRTQPGKFPSGTGTRNRKPLGETDDKGPSLRYPVPAVRAVVRDGSGRVLLLRAGEGWELPGGEFIGGTDWQGTLRAVLNQSVGAGPKQVRLVGLYSKTENDAEGRNRLVCSFLVDGLDREPKSVNAEWRLETDLPPGLPSSQRQLVEDAQAFRGEPFVR